MQTPPEEIEKLLTVCKNSKSPHLYPVTLFAVSTGARKGEILNLKWKDLDIERQTALFRETKNGESRTIPLSPLLINCILEEKKTLAMVKRYSHLSIAATAKVLCRMNEEILGKRRHGT